MIKTTVMDPTVAKTTTKIRWDTARHMPPGPDTSVKIPKVVEEIAMRFCGKPDGYFDLKFS